MSDDLSQYHAVFFEESFELLESMEGSLIDLDPSQIDDETINSIFRVAHSIKGGSATFNFAIVSEFTHILETFLNLIREGSQELTVEHVDLLLKSVDHIREMLEGYQNNESEKVQMNQDLYKAFEELIAKKPCKPDKTLQAKNESEENSNEDSEEDLEALFDSVSSEYFNKEKTSDDKKSNQKWSISFKPDSDVFKQGNDPGLFIKELSKLGDISTKLQTIDLPPWEELDPESFHLSWNIEYNGTADKDTLIQVFDWILLETDLTISPVSQQNANTSSSKNPDTNRTEIQKRSPAVKPIKPQRQDVGTIRIGKEKIDDLFNLVGELIVTQSMLQQVSKEIEISNFPKLKEGISLLEQNSRELQESVMRIRMLPISMCFNRFPRLVRDMASKLKKDIALKIEGGETEIDKTILEKLSDPLVHLVRNSVDHGIEEKEKRVQSGKDPQGTVKLIAFHQGGKVVIQVKDDGGGLDINKILKKAIEKGLVQEGDSLTQSEIYSLLFKPGFSTASQVTDLSGRGVGMDVVYRNIIDLDGKIDIQSTEGQGSTFTISLPLTLSIIDGQTIEFNNQKFIVPLPSIVESIQIKEENIRTVRDMGQVYFHRNEFIPIIKLNHLFKESISEKKDDDHYLVIVEILEKHYGLWVDELLSQQPVVIKSLEQNYIKISGIAGASLSGEGQVNLILDVPNLLDLVKKSKGVNNGNVAA